MNEGTYNYSDVEYKASSPANGSSYDECRSTVLKLFDFNATCAHKNCTFAGVWNGGGGAGQSELYLATSFYYLAADVCIPILFLLVNYVCFLYSFPFN